MSQYMTSVLGVVNALFKTAVRQAYPGQPVGKGIVQSSWRGKVGDYKYSSLPLAQLLKSSGIDSSPKDIANNVMKCLPSTAEIIEKCEIAGPGFINIFLNPSFVSGLVSDILVNGVRPPPIEHKLRIVVDFSSPNIAKEMHVGHLRSTIIGETICRLLEFMGHNVLRLNHIGDWGTQFGMLIAHLKEKCPNYLKESPSIRDLQKFYQESKKRFDTEDEFKKNCHEDKVKLQSGDSDLMTAWKLICDVSRQEMNSVYERLGVTIIERGESFYQPLMPKIVADLEKKGTFVRYSVGR